MVSNEEILRKIHSQEKRIRKLEKLAGNFQESEEVEDSDSSGEAMIQKKPRRRIHLSFTQVITFLGIVGIVIGVISFFFYAVARNWIGETGQVMMGILLGFFLFAFAFFLHKKNEGWSNIVFGGSFFIEYIAIGVGVLGYKVMPDFVGVLLAIVFLISSSVLSMHFKSRAIAYFTLVGGFLVPFITGLYEYDIFIMIFYTILSLGVVVLSFNQNWSDLRFSSFIILAPMLLYYTSRFSSAEVKAIPIAFLTTLFVLYHIAALINSIKDPKNNLSVLDSLIIVGFTMLFLTRLYIILDWPKAVYGLFIMLFSVIYLFEIFYFKSREIKVSPSTVYSLLGTGIVVLNLGFFYLTDIIDFHYLIVLFAIEYVIFSIISEKSNEEKLYKLFSIVSLIIIILMYLNIRFGKEIMLKSSVMMIVYFCILLSFIYLFRKRINFKLNAVAFIIGGFLFIYSISKYLLLFGIPVEPNQIILSILWLIYTLVLFKQVETTPGKTLIGILLGITLLKIAFKDLFYLDGINRIIGFIIFGILLLVGGYLLNKPEND